MAEEENRHPNEPNGGRNGEGGCKQLPDSFAQVESLLEDINHAHIALTDVSENDLNVLSRKLAQRRQMHGVQGLSNTAYM